MLTSFKWWIFVSFANFLLFAITCALAAGVLVFGWGVGTGTNNGTEPECPIYPREEFTRLILGKTCQEVIDEVGKPDRTSEDSSCEYWHYYHRTRNPITEKIDSDAQVIFKNGRVDAVNY